MSDGVTLERNGAVATLTLDHGKVNAMTPAMHKALYEALVSFINDDRIKVGVLTSPPGKPFSVGEDIKTPRPAETAEEKVWRHLNPHGAEAAGGEPGRPGWDWDILTLERFKPMIGAVRGWCLGQGILYLLHHTDIRLASPDAKFGFPEIGYAMGGVGGWIRLARQVPHVHALELLLTGDTIDAERAAEINLINRVVPDATLSEEAHQLAERIARHPALGIRVEMESYYRAHDMTREQATAFGAHLYRLQRVAAGEQDLGSFLRKPK
ncbi:MAG: enoyl-CoA hydratase/isomerase family protein [Devosiaceae bacterium]|nr:enoyl-CoA hydratase/isomerase family protein [Devosiaceae bacterium MH13]